MDAFGSLWLTFPDRCWDSLRHYWTGDTSCCLDHVKVQTLLVCQISAWWLITISSSPSSTHAPWMLSRIPASNVWRRHCPLSLQLFVLESSSILSIHVPQHMQTLFSLEWQAATRTEQVKHQYNEYQTAPLEFKTWHHIAGRGNCKMDALPLNYTAHYLLVAPATREFDSRSKRLFIHHINAVMHYSIFQ